MTRTGLPVVIAFVLMAMLAVGSVEAQPQSSEFRASGSFVAGGTAIDTNEDGITADLFIISGSSTLLGALTNQAVVEWTFDDDRIACPLGTVLEGTLVPAGSTVVTRAAAFDGDLLFGTFTSGANCISETGGASISAAGKFTGGTGVFAHATGDFALTASAITLISRPFVQDVDRHRDRGRVRGALRRFDRRGLSAPAFGSVVLTVKGTLNLNP